MVKISVKDRARVAIAPEKNNGVLITESLDGYHRLYWQLIDGKVVRVGRGVQKERLTSREDLYLSRPDYMAHKILAESVFASRRQARLIS